MEFRRINHLPPYVFTIIDGLKMAARRAGEDVIDLGFGNPDIPSPDIAVEKLAEAARNSRNHRYSASLGRPQPRGGEVWGRRRSTSASSASSWIPTPRSST
jgi:alanine-synthesizing transaminase